jgi:hypothetical protein
MNTPININMKSTTEAINDFKARFKAEIKKEFPDFDVDAHFDHRLKDNKVMTSAITAFEKFVLIHGKVTNHLPDNP